jgi:hypothetical protein
MIEVLRKMFEANPEKSTIKLKDKCSDCGCETILEITQTSGGFGLQGGVLFKSSTEKYIVKCSDCIKANPKKDEIKRPNRIRQKSGSSKYLRSETVYGRNNR